MAANNLKVGDLVRFNDGNFLVGMVTNVYHRSKKNDSMQVEVFNMDGSFGLCDAKYLKRYTVDSSLNKVILSLIKTLEDADEWIDNERAADYFMETFMESMNEENNKKVGD